MPNEFMYDTEEGNLPSEEVSTTSKAPKKIRMIFQTSPYPPDLGPAKRNLPFCLENVKRHEVSVLSFGTGEKDENFAKRTANNASI